MEQQVDKGLSESNEIMEQIHQCGQEILDEFVRICEENNLRYYLIAGTLLGAIRHKGPIPWDDDVDVAMPREDFEAFKKLMLARAEGEQFHIHCFENDPNFCWLFIRLLKKGTIYRAKSNIDVNIRYRELWMDIFPLDDAPGVFSWNYRILGMYIAFMKRIIRNKARNSNVYMNFKRKLVHFLLKPWSFKWFRTYTERLMNKNNGKGCKYYVSWASFYNFQKQTMPKGWYEPATKVFYNGKYYSAPHDWDKVLTQLYGDYMKLPPKNERVGHLPIEIKL